jgi:hypothetical protein
MIEALTLNGVSLASYAFMAPDISGLMTVPARRGDNVVVPGRHGVVPNGVKMFEAGELVLPLWIVGADPVTGALPTVEQEREAFFTRRDELLRLLYADPLVAAYTRPNGHTVRARVEVADVLDFTRRYDEPLAKVSIALRTLDAFWEDADSVSQTVAGATGVVVPLTAFVGSTAPVSDLLITATGPVNNPMWAHGDRWVKYNGVISTGRQLVLNTETWQVSPGTGSVWAPDPRQVEFGKPPNWLELNPATVPYSVTFTHTTGGSASSTIAGRRKYLSP